MLVRARHLARLQIKHVAGALGVNPRTVTRWEMGATSPSKEQWGKAVGYLARFVPAEAVALARAAGVASPVPEAPTVDVQAIAHGLLRVADLLDVSPRRVRAAVRELARVTASAHGSLADLARAAEEPAEQAPPP